MKLHFGILQNFIWEIIFFYKNDSLIASWTENNLPTD